MEEQDQELKLVFAPLPCWWCDGKGWTSQLEERLWFCDVCGDTGGPHSRYPVAAPIIEADSRPSVPTPEQFERIVNAFEQDDSWEPEPFIEPQENIDELISEYRSNRRTHQHADTAGPSSISEFDYCDIAWPWNPETKYSLKYVLFGDRYEREYLKEPEDLSEIIQAWTKWTWQAFCVDPKERWFVKNRSKSPTVANKALCMFPDCLIIPTTRGLCKHHYVVASGLVRRKRTTWERLEQLQKVRPPQIRADIEAQRYFLSEIAS